MGEWLRALRSPRYLPLTLLMVVIAALCVLAGTWQISRFEAKRAANSDLRANAETSPRPVAAVLPLTGQPPPSTDAIEFRPVIATGRYDQPAQVLVRKQQVNSTNGFFVLTPLRTSGGTLLVVRGFVTDAGKPVAPAPSGPVTVRGRAFPPQTGPDHYGQLHNGQVETINPSQAAARLGSPVYDGYLQLEGGQPGAAGLTAIPGPDLSNPAGGAVEPQHLAYIGQWYLFAALALAAPLVIIRTERKRAIEDAAARAADPQPAAETAQERLAQRYGRSR